MENSEKNKKGIANLLYFIAIILIVSGAIIGFSDIYNNWGTAFCLCLTGTILSFVSTYLKNGYIKFFN